ncbi:MAG: hypothetical protein M3N47_13185, partial [Chloroflexota bacterium]|nr:hypothetical protein [Chloroflexota bacterium]
DALGRVLRLLAAHGIFEPATGGYRHTSSSSLLRSDHPMSMRAFARLNGLPVFSATFAELGHSVRTGSPALEVVAGDFFTDPLPSCDAYLLMNILHDWDDENALRILAAVAKSGEPGAVVLVIETVMPEGPEPHWAKTLDVLMLAVTGGRERTEAQYRSLLAEAGIDLVRTVPTATPFSIVEGRVR